MAATSSNPASSTSLAEIAEAATSWARTASSMSTSYATLRAKIARDMLSALVHAGLDVNTATDLTEELRVNVSNFSSAFDSLAEIGNAIAATRDDILDQIAKAKKNGTPREFRIGA